MKFIPSREDTALQAYRAAQKEKMRSEPFTPDRLGTYAFLERDEVAPDTVCVYLFDAEYRMIHRQILPARRAVPEKLCPRLTGMLQRENACFLGVVVSAPDSDQPRGTDLWQLSRIAFFCEEQGIPVLDLILLWKSGYIPLSRIDGTELFYETILMEPKGNKENG